MGSYFGSKATSGLCQPIIALMPPHDTYIETHLGGGAIMKRKPPALHNIGIDLNPRAVAAFECDYPVKKVNDCAHRFLAEYDYGGRELIYSDPPYLHHTRTSGRRYRFDVTTHPYQHRAVPKRPFEWRPADCIPDLPWSAGNWRCGNRPRRTLPAMESEAKAGRPQ